MKLLLTGASGLLGDALIQQLPILDYHIDRLRRIPSETEPYWNPEKKIVRLGPTQTPNAVIHLAGENISNQRWTPEFKQRIRDSRLHGTRLIAETIASWNPRPDVLICASGIGYYGNQQATLIDESSAPGTGFFAELTQELESATDAAKEAGIRVVHLRLAVVLSNKGGAFLQLVAPFRWGLGSILGSGNQYMSWIHLDDVVQIIDWILKKTDIEGPVNVVAPNPITNREFTKTLGRYLKRPTFFRTPSWLLRAMLGEMAEELLLSSTRAIPQKLLESQYLFRYPDLEAALQNLCQEK